MESFCSYRFREFEMNRFRYSSLDSTQRVVYIYDNCSCCFYNPNHGISQNTGILCNHKKGLSIK